jgi:hypothetical protein
LQIARAQGIIKRSREVVAVAKAADPQTVALQALAQALGDPTPKVLFGTAKVPSFFKGSTQAIKNAARLCEERQWLAATGEWIGRGKSKKPTYRVTPSGVQAVLDHGEPLTAVRGLQSTLEQQVQLFGSLREQLGQMVEHVRPLTEVVNQLARRVEPPNVDQLVRQLSDSTTPRTSAAPAPAKSTPAATGEWLNDAVRLITEQQQRDRYQPLTLPQFFAALRRSWPALTLGQFHDGLRTLRDQGRIRLSPYTRALATLDDGRNAIFLDGEVMYYAQLP